MIKFFAISDTLKVNKEHLYTSPQIFSEDKISGLRWESNPHLHISSVMLYQLSYHIFSSEKILGLVYKCSLFDLV